MSAEIKGVIDAWSKRPFRYGADCCTFVGEVLERITGENPMQRFRYRDKREAYAIIDGFGSLEAAAAAVFPESVNDAQDGDVCVFLQANGTEVAGVVYQGRIIARTPSGIMDYPLSWAKRFWRPDACHK